ncbi:MAG: hypothetical protein AB1792_02920 [Candidatus Zixiibacteriota bacterium]
MKRMLAVVSTALIAVGGWGCGGDSGSGPAPGASTNWAVEIRTVASDGPGVIDDEAQRLPTALPGEPDSVTITGGALVLRSLRLTATATAVDTNITAEDESRDQNDADISHPGPYLLAFDGNEDDLGTAVVPAGTYECLKFVIQPGLTGDMAGRAIAVTGTIWRDGRGENYIFATDYASEFLVNGSFSVPSGAAATGHLVFAADRWFRTGPRWLDPNQTSNRRTIIENIRRNISAHLEVVPVGTLQ